MVRLAAPAFRPVAPRSLELLSLCCDAALGLAEVADVGVQKLPCDVDSKFDRTAPLQIVKAHAWHAPATAIAVTRKGLIVKSRVVGTRLTQERLKKNRRQRTRPMDPHTRNHVAHPQPRFLQQLGRQPYSTPALSFSHLVLFSHYRTAVETRETKRQHLPRALSWSWQTNFQYTRGLLHLVQMGRLGLAECERGYRRDCRFGE